MKIQVAAIAALGFLARTVAADGHDAYPVEADVEEVEYTDPYDNDFDLLGYVSIPEDFDEEEDDPLPAVVIIPDWNNVDEYEKVRATMMAEEFGWIGFAADIYGPDLQDVEDRDTRREQATLYRSNTTLFTGRIQAAIDVMRDHPAVDESKVAVIGYCWGGTGVLTHAFMGGDGVVGGVSFHGGLTEFDVATNISYPIAVMSGGADDTGTEVEFLEEQLNAANATWQITRYSGIEHAFTVWTDDRYNKVADERSWREMETFFSEAFGEFDYGTIPPNSTEVNPVEYDDDGFELTGWLAIPEDADTAELHPAVVIVPDWDGVSGADGYESQRATLLAEEGYIALAADIYGSEFQQVENFTVRVELATLYRTDYELFVSRIQAAVDVLKNHEMVDEEQILMIGYCFGGTGAVNYAFADLTDVKAVVPFHGGLTSLAPIETDVIYPYMLVQSGGEDDAHGNNTELEMALNDANATWEITRYSNVFHGFTSWTSQAYNEVADWRSWDAMLQVFEMILEVEDESSAPSIAPSIEPTVSPQPSAAPNTDAVACPLDVMECPDGSFVGRVEPDCEFEECPETEEPTDPQTEEPTSVACPLDAMECPDGSSVGRVPPDCEFEECPDPVACSLEVMECPDGSTVGRVPPDCEFEECPDPVACSLEVMECPDGSSVGRVPPDCEFEECPDVEDDDDAPEVLPEVDDEVVVPEVLPEVDDDDENGDDNEVVTPEVLPAVDDDENEDDAVTPEVMPATPGTVSKSIKDLAIETEELETLESALEAAELVETFDGEDLYTVFAPVNAAFEEIDPDTLRNLLEDPKGFLTEILLTHVVPGILEEVDLRELIEVPEVEVPAIEVPDVEVPDIETPEIEAPDIEKPDFEAPEVEIQPVTLPEPSLSGENLVLTTSAITRAKGGLQINGANIIKSDIRARNGVVHLIDRVLIPRDGDEGSLASSPIEDSFDEIDSLDGIDEGSLASFPNEDSFDEIVVAKDNPDLERKLRGRDRES